MRQVFYRKRHSLKNRHKMMSICETYDEQDCKTSVRKYFIYVVSKEDNIDQNINPPRIDIKKYFNTKTREERFHFRVKGYFYISREAALLKVRFCHSLKISIVWKSKELSPKKSVTLT